MTRTDLAIHDIARALSDLQVKDREQRRAIFIKSLEGLVHFAITEFQVAPILAAQDDMRKVGEILARSKI
jgi:hypothetical protein